MNDDSIADEHFCINTSSTPTIPTGLLVKKVSTPPGYQPGTVGSWSFPTPSSLPTCLHSPAVPTNNRFSVLLEESTIEAVDMDEISVPTRAPPPLLLTIPAPIIPAVVLEQVQSMVEYKIDYIPSTVTQLTDMKEQLSHINPGSITTLPLPGMIHNIIRGWTPARPQSSPAVVLDISICRNAYTDLGLPLPTKKNCSVRHIKKRSIFDIEVQIDRPCQGGRNARSQQL